MPIAIMCASMPWMRMPGQTWLGAAASFVAMWDAMMVPMMLPSLALTLRRANTYNVLTILGYFFVWTIIGALIFPIGVALAPATPAAIGITVLIAAAIQFSKWKAHHLAGCREIPDAPTAWQRGIRLGIRCSATCGNLMLLSLVLGMMDLRVMALVTAAITCERFAPERTARAIGAITGWAGVLLLARAAGL